MLEKTILSNLILNEDFCRKVFPYLKDDYFDDLVLRSVFETASDYLEKYKEPPSLEALKIAVDKRKDLSEDTYQGVHQLVDSMSIDTDTQLDFLLDETEKFCQDKDLYNSIRKSIMILDGQDSELGKGEIPKTVIRFVGYQF